jgi:putative ABC transport system permease protein
LTDRVRRAPGVTSVSLAARPPLSNSFVTRVWADAAAQPVTAGYNLVDSEFFAALGISIVNGRTFTAEAVRSGWPEVVVSESLAQRLWPSMDPLGKRLDLRFATAPVAPRTSAKALNAVVAGVARDTQRAKLLLDASPYYVYVPLTLGWTPTQTSLIVRAASRADVAVSVLRSAMRSVNVTIPVEPRVLADVLKERRQPVAIAARLAAVFGGLALLIAVVGEYGLVSYSVTQRTREIGGRVALGAQTRTVVGFIVRQGAVMVGTGVIAGMVLSAVAGQGLAKFLFRVSPFDFATYASVTVVFLVTGLLAVWAPAHRAATVNPLVALRQP